LPRRECTMWLVGVERKCRANGKRRMSAMPHSLGCAALSLEARLPLCWGRPALLGHPVQLGLMFKGEQTIWLL
jgi:hypothetical protein